MVLAQLTPGAKARRDDGAVIAALKALGHPEPAHGIANKRPRKMKIFRRPLGQWRGSEKLGHSLALRSSARKTSLNGTLGFRSSVHDQFGMQAAESLDYVAVPTDWLVRGEDIRKLFRAELLPLGRFEIPP
jgi:hypothetical protein